MPIFIENEQRKVFVEVVEENIVGPGACKEIFRCNEDLSDEIINTISEIDGLKVIARTSTFVYKDRYADIREIGNQLDVETILEGSIQKIGDRVRIIAQLVKVEDGSHIWSERYDHEIEDLFQIVDQTEFIVVHMQDGDCPVLSGGPQPVANTPANVTPVAFLVHSVVEFSILSAPCCSFVQQEHLGI